MNQRPQCNESGQSCASRKMEAEKLSNGTWKLENYRIISENTGSIHR